MYEEKSNDYRNCKLAFETYYVSSRLYVMLQALLAVCAGLNILIGFLSSSISLNNLIGFVPWHDY